MEKEQYCYACIDLKSFYASVECVDRGLDPLTARLVVADASRTDKTICLAVSPALKAYGVPGRGRLFEVKQRLREIRDATGQEIDFIIAPPRMARYISVSSDIYEIYLKYLAPEDIHVYSIDEVFLDFRPYGKLYGDSIQGMVRKIIREVVKKTGITATGGVGTNMYLAKIAMDILAKKSPADEYGVRLAALDQRTYREKFWDHLPLTDFWQIGHGTVKRLGSRGLRTMGDIARCSLGKPGDFYNEELLYDLFGVNAELLIDHAWGVEPCTMEDIKGYEPSTTSHSVGQVLTRPYAFSEARIIVREMIEQLILELVDRGQITDAIVLHVGYDKENTRPGFQGQWKMDAYGRKIPRSAHGTAGLGTHTACFSRIIPAVMELFEHIVDENLLVRRVNITAIRLQWQGEAVPQLNLFTDHHREMQEQSLQKTMLGLRKRYGKNTVLRGLDYLEGATTIERNRQIGGHRA